MEIAETKNNELRSGSIIVKNTLWNLGGQVVLIIVALVAIPILINKLGTERFGVLTLAWMIIGYFSLFDLGLGRALTQVLAKNLGGQEKNNLTDIAWTAQLVMFVLGVIGAIALWLLSPLLVQNLLKIPQSLQPETLKSFYVLALSIPLVTSSAGLSGILMAYQRFDLLNAVQIPLGAFSFLGPLFVLLFSTTLYPIIIILVLGRLISWAANFLLCARVMPTTKKGISMQTKELLPLMRLGGWMAISNVVGPIMVYLDRFLIGSLLSVASVAYYATSYELVTKLWIVPGSVVSVLFPTFAYLLSRDKMHVTLIFGRAVKYVFFALFPFTILIMAFAHEGLDIWLGSEFANNSSHVLRWLALGVFINSIAQVPFALIQGIGRPDLTSKLHLVEFPFYLLTLWFLINAFGIVGAAIAWVARVAGDAILLFIVTNKILEPHSPVVRRTVLIAGGTLLALVFNAIPNTFTVKICYLLLTFLVLTPSTWFFVLNAEERLFLRDLLNAPLSSFRRKTW